MSRRFPVVSLVAVLLIAATPPSASAEDREKVREAIGGGLTYLRQRQNDDGSWEFANHDVGITALAALTLVENGTPLGDSAIRRAYDFVRKECLRSQQTYDVALTIILLSRVGDRRDRALVRGLANRLTAGQLTSGGWTYTVPILTAEQSRNPSLRPARRSDTTGDNSNTQFAVLGLWAASRAGADVEQAFRSIEKRFRTTQAATGGWNYQGTPDSETPSMSFAGLFALAVAEADDIRRQQRQAAEQQKPSRRKASRAKSAQSTKASPSVQTPQAPVADPPAQSLMADAAFSKGLQRVGQIIAQPIQPAQYAAMNLTYFLWSVERLGVLLALPRFGDVAWYEKGSRMLLESQKPDGSWELGIGGPIANTCFALLFLRQANLGSDISRLLQGDPEKAFVLVVRPDRPRFRRLDEAVAAAKDGEIIDVEGPGPYAIAHLLFDKALTVRAAEGYEPIFTFTRGNDRFGLIRDPVKDAEARHLFNVKKTTVTLEGLRLQMDPPLGIRAPWGVIGLSDGNLRLVNCTLSETVQVGTAGVAAAGNSSVELRNCMCVGLRVAIDLTAQGQHTLRLENCVLFGPGGLRIGSADATANASVSIVLRHNTVHAKELLDLADMGGEVAIEADGNAFRLDWVSSSFVSPRGGKRSWQGGRAKDGAPNLYDVRRWIGSRGKPLPEVKNLDTWRRYWKTEEAGSVQAAAPFASFRQLGAYRHDLSALDWRIVAEQLDQREERPFGGDVFQVGTGQAYGQFRESQAQ